MSNFIRTSKGIINRNLISYVGFFKGNDQIEVSVHGGFSFRFQGEEALMILQCLVPSSVVTNSDEIYKEFIRQQCKDIATQEKAALMTQKVMGERA